MANLDVDSECKDAHNQHAIECSLHFLHEESADELGGVMHADENMLSVLLEQDETLQDYDQQDEQHDEDTLRSLPEGEADVLHIARKLCTACHFTTQERVNAGQPYIYHAELGHRLKQHARIMAQEKQKKRPCTEDECEHNTKRPWKCHVVYHPRMEVGVMLNNIQPYEIGQSTMSAEELQHEMDAIHDEFSLAQNEEQL